MPTICAYLPPAEVLCNSFCLSVDCDEYCNEFCLSFNVKESKVLLFGNVKNLTIDALLLDNKTIEVVSEWKYLGITITSGRDLVRYLVLSNGIMIFAQIALEFNGFRFSPHLI